VAYVLVEIVLAMPDIWYGRYGRYGSVQGVLVHHCDVALIKRMRRSPSYEKIFSWRSWIRQFCNVGYVAF